MLSDEVASASAPFFDQIGPSHDEITTLIRRAGLADLDPSTTSTNPVGKMRRVRSVLFAAVDRRLAGGERFVQALIDAIRANGGFRPGDPNYPGAPQVRALQAALYNWVISLTTTAAFTPCTWRRSTAKTSPGP